MKNINITGYGPYRCHMINKYNNGQELKVELVSLQDGVAVFFNKVQIGKIKDNSGIYGPVGTVSHGIVTFASPSLLTIEVKDDASRLNNKAIQDRLDYLRTIFSEDEIGEVNAAFTAMLYNKNITEFVNREVNPASVKAIVQHVIAGYPICFSTKNHVLCEHIANLFCFDSFEATI